MGSGQVSAGAACSSALKPRRGGGGGGELGATQGRLMRLLPLVSCQSDTSLCRALTSDASDKLCCQSKAISQRQ